MERWNGGHVENKCIHICCCLITARSPEVSKARSGVRGPLALALQSAISGDLIAIAAARSGWQCAAIFLELWQPEALTPPE